LCLEFDLMFNVVTSIEFWVSLALNKIIVKLSKSKLMNNLKSIMIGVGAVVWDHNIMTCNALLKNENDQDVSDGGSIPPSHPFA
jgi:uncharacterized protein (DUF983 family)